MKVFDYKEQIHYNFVLIIESFIVVMLAVDFIGGFDPHTLW